MERILPFVIHNYFKIYLYGVWRSTEEKVEDSSTGTQHHIKAAQTDPANPESNKSLTTVLVECIQQQASQI